MKMLFLASVLAAAVAAAPSAQQQERPLSPPGTATTMVMGDWVKNAEGNTVYQGGKWIEVEYSRPMLRQRANIFGTGADYGKAVKAGGTVWRAGANATTLFKTEVPLVFNGKTLPAGTYGMLVDLKSPTEWALILTSQPRMKAFDANNKTELMGSTNYDPKFDVIRVPMEVDSSFGPRIDQLTFFFADMTKDAGRFAIAWDKTIASVEFKVAR